MEKTDHSCKTIYEKCYWSFNFSKKQCTEISLKTLIDIHSIDQAVNTTVVARLSEPTRHCSGLGGKCRVQKKDIRI